MSLKLQRVKRGGVGALVVWLGAAVAHAGPPPATAAAPTFTKDIAPVLQRSCQNCHRPNGAGPMPLTTYEEVRPWARSIKLKTALREMPPWYIEKNVGIQKFKDDPSLSDEEIAMVATWVDNGAVRGDPADLPPPLVFPEVGAWSLGPPDLIVSSAVYTVRAVGGDTFPNLGHTPTGLTEGRYIKAFEMREFRPQEQKYQRVAGQAGDLNYFVFHHAAVGSAPGEGDGSNDGIGRTSWRYTFNVGQNAISYPDELGILLPAGSNIYFPNNHMHSIGREVQVQLQVGFWFHPQGYTPKYPQRTARAPGRGSLSDLDIPAGMDNVRHDSYTTLRSPARMVNFEPHLHASGKRMCVEAIYPNGYREMLNCAGYNHNWVRVYVYEDDVAPLLPAGTILHTIGWHDNSAKNPRNVDPRNWKGMGHRSIDDMFQLSSLFVYLTEEEFQAEVAAREAKKRQSATTTAQNNN